MIRHYRILQYPDIRFYCIESAQNFLDSPAIFRFTDKRSAPLPYSNLEIAFKRSEVFYSRKLIESNHIDTSLRIIMPGCA